MRANKILYINYGTYCVGHNELGVPEASLGKEGLVFPGVSNVGGALVRTGTFSGPIEITVATLDERPRQDEQTWEMTDGAELISAGNEVVVWEIFGVGEGLPRFATIPGERFRIRVSVNGFTAGKDAGDLASTDTPVESHLVQLWPATD